MFISDISEPSTAHKHNWPKAVKKLLWFLQIVTKLCNYLALVVIHINGVCHVGDGHWLLMRQLPGLEFWSSLLRPCRRRVDIASSASAHRRHTYVTHWRRFRGRAVQIALQNANERLWMSKCLNVKMLMNVSSVSIRNISQFRIKIIKTTTKLNLHHCACQKWRQRKIFNFV